MSFDTALSGPGQSRRIWVESRYGPFGAGPVKEEVSVWPLIYRISFGMASDIPNKFRYGLSPIHPYIYIYMYIITVSGYLKISIHIHIYMHMHRIIFEMASDIQNKFRYGIWPIYIYIYIYIYI